MASLSGRVTRDQRWALVLGGAVLLVIVAVSLLAPVAANNDPRPSTYNTAPGGAKAAYLVLESMGYGVGRWERPALELAGVDAPHTTLVLAAPRFTSLEKDAVAKTVKGFLERGGRVLAAGPESAPLLPGGTAAIKGSQRLKALCYTRPEGPGALARAGEVEMMSGARWDQERPGLFVEQRCGTEAVVVRFRVGAGEVVWWSSASPMTNAELHRDGDLRLLLASVGPNRRVLFDESLQDEVPTQWSAVRDLPLRSLLAQAALLFVLVVFSFSRRRGPLRLPVAVPRSSPLEFAVSMGDLYSRAGATGAATEAARRQLERVLVREAGVPAATVENAPGEVDGLLAARLGGAWTVGSLLQESREAADLELRPGAALRLVQALGRDAQRVRDAVAPRSADRKFRADAETQPTEDKRTGWRTQG